MKLWGMVLGSAGLSISLLALSQASQKAAVGQASKPSRSRQMQVVPDLNQRLARFRQVHMSLDASELSSREKQMIPKLVDACRYLDDIYWRQVDPDALGLYQSLEGSQNPRDVDLRRFLWINGSRF